MSLLAVILSYLIGSIPTGLWVGLRVRGIDIREHGSKNIGATNTMRVLGKKWGAVALAGDMGKGLIAVAALARLGEIPYLPLACGFAAILGHTFSVFLRFRGGKGVATGAGVFLGLCPIPTLIAAAVFVGVVAISRMVSLGSICGAVVLCAGTFVFGSQTTYSVLAVMVAALVIWKHRSNIGRILSGKENKI